jgi:hypothetical protein
MDFWSFFWLLIWSFVFVAYLMILFQILGDLFRVQEVGGFGKAIWVIALIVFPYLSALVYVIVRGQGMATRSTIEHKRAEAAQKDYIRSVAASAPSPVDQLTRALGPGVCRGPQLLERVGGAHYFS